MASVVNPRTRLSVPYDDGVVSRSDYIKRGIAPNIWQVRFSESANGPDGPKKQTMASRTGNTQANTSTTKSGIIIMQKQPTAFIEFS